MCKKSKVIKTVILFLISVTCFFAQNRGYEIMKKNDELKEANDAKADVTLVLVKKDGKKKFRKMTMFSKKRKEGFDSFFEIKSPSDVEGMRFLTLARKGDDEQRMFLPALGKARRISGSSKDGKFLGSDLYFYDLEDHDLEDYDYKFIKEDKMEGVEYFVVESRPKDKKAPYSKILSWVRKDNYFVYKDEMYEKKQGRLLKTNVIKETKEIQGIIEPIKMIVTNHQEKQSTYYLVENINVNTGLKEEIFKVKNLEN